MSNQTFYKTVAYSRLSRAVRIIATLMILFAGRAQASDLFELSHILNGSIREIELYNDYKVGAAGSYFVVLDHEMDFVDDFRVSGEIVDFVIQNEYLYCILEGGTIEIYNISALPNATKISEITFTTEINSIAVKPGLIFAATIEGIKVIETSALDAPTVIDEIMTGSAYSKCVLNDEYLFASLQYGDIQLINLTTYELVSLLETEGEVQDFMLFGDFVYTLSGWQYIEVFNTFDEHHPTRESQTLYSNFVNRLYVEGADLYVTTNFGSIAHFDVLEPSMPIFLTETTIDGWLYDIEVSGGSVFCAGLYEGILKFDIGDEITIADQYDICGYVSKTVFKDDKAYIAFGSSGLLTLDISDPSEPVIMHHYDMEYAGDLAIFGDYLYVIDEATGIVVFDIAFEGMPEYVRTIDPESGLIRGISIYDNPADDPYLYTMNIRREVICYRLEPAEDPVRTDIVTPRRPAGTDIEQIWEFLAVTTPEGIEFYDNIYFPESPRWYNSIDITGTVVDVSASDDIIVVATLSEGIKIFQISRDVPMVSEVGGIPYIEGAIKVDVFDKYALVSSRTEGMYVLNIKDPENPYIVDRYEYSSYGSFLDEVNGLIAVSQGQDGLQLLDGRGIIKSSIVYHTGWNMVSLPFLPEDAEVGSGLPFTYIGNFAYDAETRDYETASELTPGIGYFYFHEFDTIVEIEGEEITSLIISLRPGWNMIGTPSDDLPISSLGLTGSPLGTDFFWYDPETNAYVPETQALRANKAYWVLSLASATLHIEDGVVEFYRVAPRHDELDYNPSDFPPFPPGTEHSDNVQDKVLFEVNSSPNPFNSNASVSISIETEGYVDARIVDINGKTVHTIAEMNMTPGMHSFVWNADNNIPSGVYFFKVTTNKVTVSRRMILAR